MGKKLIDIEIDLLAISESIYKTSKDINELRSDYDNLSFKLMELKDKLQYNRKIKENVLKKSVLNIAFLKEINDKINKLNDKISFLYSIIDEIKDYLFHLKEHKKILEVEKEVLLKEKSTLENKV